MERRSFLRTSGIFTAGIYASHARAIAGPFLPGELIHNIPVDKKLDPSWVSSLSKRGFVTKYLKSRNELKYIGMPAGGLQTGTVYLGGDGRLWLWDIFNANQNGVDPKTISWHSAVHVGKKVRSQDGSAYVQPAEGIRPLDQGFAFRIKTGSGTIIKKMAVSDWDEIVFEATYPMARIQYIDKQLPVEISADVFSPFIPLDEKNSSLPCTLYSFSIKNKTADQVEVDILGWLENKVSPHSAKEGDERTNAVIKRNAVQLVQCSIKDNGDEKQRQQPDHGTLSIACLSDQVKCNSDLAMPISEASFVEHNEKVVFKKITDPLIAAVSNKLKLPPSSTRSVDFVIGWHFVNLHLHKDVKDHGRYYNNWFKSSADVVDYVSQHGKELAAKSRLWKKTWFDSTLPWWFLERTFLNISILATTTAHRFESGRFYAWEGVGCCAGTCTHVWQYAHAMGRVFPSIERDTRERVDLGLSLQEDGSMWFRGEAAKAPAIDGQAGTILRIYREHQMSADDGFLKRNWNNIKKTIQWMMAQDRNGDGMEDTPIENTLDAKWDGEIAWLVGLCITAAKAGELMALEMGDEDFAKACANYVSKGSSNMEEKLFNGEYFIHRPDAVKGRSALGSYNTCHIDQVYGESWGHQVGLGRIIDRQKTVSALKALWKYNFTPDVGPYIKDRPGGRPYVLPGEGGLVMNTNPRNEKKPYGENETWQLGYFHECMTGFEHQVAAHMMAEGMVDESLVITRMIHDRYHAAKRNPFNEIECSDHYARSMASYGTFITACGFEYHGPKGYIRFAPRMGAANFRAPFTAAEGWGSFAQQKSNNKLTASLQINYGRLQLKTFSVAPDHVPSKAIVKLDQKTLVASLQKSKDRWLIVLKEPVMINSGQTLHLTVS